MDTPTVAEFKAHFYRDFPYGTDMATSVLDADISKAQTEASFNINEDLFASQAEYTLAFHYLTAHFLVSDLKASSEGLGGSYSWLQNNKSVGSVSASYSIPQSILDNPTFSMIAKTNYGAKYLTLILPRISGQIYTVCGGTLA